MKIFLRSLDRLPSKYTDLIMLFHQLLDECFTPSRKNITGNLAIILDGLDEAAVAYPQLNISDWFYNYDENGEVTETAGKAPRISSGYLHTEKDFIDSLKVRIISPLMFFNHCGALLKNQ